MNTTSRTTQTNSPPAWAQGLFETSAADAQRLYDSGVGGQTYTGSTVAPLSDTTMQGVNRLAQAGNNWNTSGTRPLYGELGAAAVSNPAVGALGNVAGSVGDIASGATGIGTEADYRNILQRAGGPSAAEQYLTGYARGDNLQGDGNPFYRQRLEGELADTAALTNSSMAGAGRFGSGAHTGVLTDRLAQARVGALENDWNREQANQFAATGMIDAGRNANTGNMLQAVSGISGVQGQNIGNRLSAAGTQAGAYGTAGALYGQGVGQATTAADRMAGLDQQNLQNERQGAQDVLSAGGIMDTQAGRLLADEIAKFYAVDNQDWTRLGMLQSAAAGAAGPYGTQVATSRQPMNFMSPLSALAGNPAMFGGKSDIRLKEDIEPVGILCGIPVYTFRYIGIAGRWFGAMAQEVMKLVPDAVFMESDGFYAIDYRRLGFPMMRID